MTEEKWFARSRGLWAAALPLIVAIAAAAGLEIDQLGEQLDRLAVALINAIGAGFALRSRFRPDHAELKALPKLPGGGGGTGSGLAILALVAVLACASTPEARYLQTSQAWLSAHRTYNAVLATDNALFEACLRRAAERCEPSVSVAQRNLALLVVNRGNSVLDALELRVAGESDEGPGVEVLARDLEQLALELSAIAAAGAD